MASYHSFLDPARRSLVNHLARLCDTLDGLGKQVREAITRTIGRSVADAVSEAVEAMLAVTVVRSRPGHYSNYYDRQSNLWERPAGNSWQHEPDEWDDPDSMPRRYTDQEEDEGLTYGGDHRRIVPHETRLRLAMLIGCQATGWWLNRHPRKLAWPGAVGIGLFSGLVTFVSGPVVIAGAGGVLSALSLFALADAVRTSAVGLTNSENRRP